MNKIKWYIKQLLPLTYRCNYEANGKKYFCIWNMWFGKSYNIETYEIKDIITNISNQPYIFPFDN